MPTSKLNVGQPNPPSNGVPNGSVPPTDPPRDVSRNGDPCGDGPRHAAQKFPLDRFVQDNLDDSGVASGSSVLSTSSSEALDSRVAEPSAVNGDGHPGVVSNGSLTSSRRSPDLRVRFSDSDSSDNSNIPATSDRATSKDSSPTEGATGVNPTLWLGDDQMLLLPGNSRSEETDSNNSGASESKSFEGLLSPNGTSILWDEDTDWILLFDNMIRYADRKQHRTTRSCGCKGEHTLSSGSDLLPFDRD